MRKVIVHGAWLVVVAASVSCIGAVVCVTAASLLPHEKILVLQSGRGASRNLKKQIHTDREIRRVQQTDSASGVFHHLPDSWQFAVPSRGSYHNAFLGAHASFHVAKHCSRRSEIDDHIDWSQMLRSEGRSLRIVVSAKHIDMMPSLSRHFRDQRSRFAPP